MRSSLQLAARRAVVAVTVVALLPAPALGAASASAADSVSALPSSLSVEHVGANEVRLTNTGDKRLRIGMRTLRRSARAFGLDPRSSCLAKQTLAAGATCELVLRSDLVGAVTGPAPAGVSPVSVEFGPDGEATLTNRGAEDVRLRGVGSLRWLGVRGGTCMDARVVAAGGACTLELRSAATPTRSLSTRLARAPAFAAGAPRSLASPVAILDRSDVRAAMPPGWDAAWNAFVAEFARVVFGVTWFLIVYLLCSSGPTGCTY